MHTHVKGTTGVPLRVLPQLQAIVPLKVQIVKKNSDSVGLKMTTIFYFIFDSIL